MQNFAVSSRASYAFDIDVNRQKTDLNLLLLVLPAYREHKN